MRKIAPMDVGARAALAGAASRTAQGRRLIARRAFTLVELMVVIAIIASLIAILLPSMGKARFTAKVAVCASQMHQWSNTLTSYAAMNKAWYPISEPRGAVNTIDLEPMFVTRLRADYNLPLAMFFCPLRPDEYCTESFLNNAATLRTMGYSYWTPRITLAGVVNNLGGSAGPSRVTDSNRNPLWTDALLEFPDFGWPTLDTFSPIWGRSHDFQGRMTNTNVLNPDGGVETRPVRDWQFRYQTGNARMWY